MSKKTAKTLSAIVLVTGMLLSTAACGGDAKPEAKAKTAKASSAAPYTPHAAAKNVADLKYLAKFVSAYVYQFSNEKEDFSFPADQAEFESVLKKDVNKEFLLDGVTATYKRLGDDQFTFTLVGTDFSGDNSVTYDSETDTTK